MESKPKQRQQTRIDDVRILLGVWRKLTWPLTVFQSIFTLWNALIAFQSNSFLTRVEKPTCIMLFKVTMWNGQSDNCIHQNLPGLISKRMARNEKTWYPLKFTCSAVAKPLFHSTDIPASGTHVVFHVSLLQTLSSIYYIHIILCCILLLQDIFHVFKLLPIQSLFWICFVSESRDPFYKFICFIQLFWWCETTLREAPLKICLSHWQEDETIPGGKTDQASC